MELKELTTILRCAAEAGAGNALAAAAQVQDHLTKSEAFRMYGRSNVERWISEGLLVPLAPNGKLPRKCMNRTKLEAIAAASNRITYLPVAER